MLSCQHTYEVFRLARIFDPSFVSDNEAAIDNAFVSNLAAIKPSHEMAMISSENCSAIFIYTSQNQGVLLLITVTSVLLLPLYWHGGKIMENPQGLGVVLLR